MTRVAVTGWGQDRDEANPLSAGSNHQFTKPHDPDELLERLRSHP